jgi:hypothetical protein
VLILNQHTYHCLIYWTAENFQDIWANRPSTTLHEDSVMAPKLPIEHRVDVNRMFLTTLNLYMCVCVLLLLSHLFDRRERRGGRIRRG